MKAIKYLAYGSPNVLQIAEVDKPVPKDNEVLLRVQAASLNAADLHLLKADPFLTRVYSGLFKPKFNILGADIAGTVESAGKNVSRFKPGDEVFGDISACGFGGLAEYVCAPEYLLVAKPGNISFEQAAATPMAAVTALQGLRDVGKIKCRSKVLIIGASGGVGTFAIQIAKSFDAEVTAICSTNKLDTAKKIGADKVIDYTKNDFSENGERYDLIFAANGLYDISKYKSALTKTGVYVAVGGSSRQLFQAILIGPFYSKSTGKKMTNLLAKTNQKDLGFISNLLEAGIIKPVIDRRYALNQTADAFRYLEEGHAAGKIIITF